jgi:4-hydroxythreonine-4-phosphate dehydrogenase
MKPIVITPGEPAGLGLDIALKLAEHQFKQPLVLVTDYLLLKKRAQTLGLSCLFPSYDAKILCHPPISVLHTSFPSHCLPGQPCIENVPALLKTLDMAINLCQTNECAAMVTGPVNKAIINEAGIPFTGHTEYLAQKTGVQKTVMLMTNPHLNIALLTTHLPLAKVPAAITKQHIEECVAIISHDFKQRFGNPHPRIMVLGLNPHAGEDGHIGTEEITTICPTIKKLQQQGYDITGPIPADTAFLPHTLKQTDIVLAMYHDQGLPVIKSQDFNRTVNVTLGLPIIRASVDHGTAFDLAGTGKANEQSLCSAITLASTLAQHSHEDLYG